MSVTVHTPVPTPTPTVTPEIIHQTITKVYQVVSMSPQLVTGLTLGGLALLGYLLSVFHDVVERLANKNNPDGWSAGVNVAIQVVVGLLVSAGMGLADGTLKPTFVGFEQFVGSFLVVMGTSQTRWAFFKWTQSLGTPNVTSNPISAVEETVPQKANL